MKHYVAIASKPKLTAFDKTARTIRSFLIIYIYDPLTLICFLMHRIGVSQYKCKCPNDNIIFYGARSTRSATNSDRKCVSTGPSILSGSFHFHGGNGLSLLPFSRGKRGDRWPTVIHLTIRATKPRLLA